MTWQNKRTPAPDYQPRDKVYLDASDIHTTRPSRKLSHQRLGPFPIVRKVGNSAYRLQLPPSMTHLHPIFNIVKLTLALEDPISGQHPLPPPPLLEIVDGEEEWVVEEILDSKVINRKLCYLVKWEGFGMEHNSWEPQNNLHGPERVAEFHQKNPGVPQQIQFVDFNMIPFQTLTPVVMIAPPPLFLFPFYPSLPGPQS